jgi:hypothetical protein
VLDVSVNKIIKQYLEEYKDIYADKHFDEWKAGKYSVRDRHILLTQWVAQAWERLHLEHKDTIIKTFWNVGLALNSDGSEDNELSIRDLPDLIVRDYTIATTYENPIVIPNNDDVDRAVDGYLYIAQESEARITVKDEKEDDITANSSDESDICFDYDSDNDFDDDIDRDKD